GNDTKKYTGLDFVGIETVTNTVDASEMTTLHLDVWSPDFTLFGIKLVDFGADGAFGGGDDTEHQIDVPGLAQGEWVSLAFPLSDFVSLASTEHLGQYIIVGQPTAATTLYVDNFYFSKEDVTVNEPLVAAPDPTEDPSNVISLFSGVYTDVPVDTWRTDWSAATLEDIQIQGNDTKKYTNLDFVGVETVSNTIDASGMTHFRVDVWSPDATFFGIKLVDFGADGAFGGGDDVEHQINFETPAQGEWVSYDIPLSDFVGLTTTEHIGQYIYVAQPTATSTVYLDNVYFYNDATSVSSFAENNVALFPNPVQSSFMIRTEKSLEEVSIYNALGALVLRETVLDQTSEFDISNLTSGTYFVFAIIEGKTMVERLIKN
ncbi:MAG: T9SS type A sorting domain-containing protein, partial [Bacteroidota bacterium]